MSWLIRSALMGLVLLLPGLASAQSSDPEPVIGIVEFAGADGARVTGALKDLLVTRGRLGARVSDIRIIDRAKYDAALERAGSEEKAAALLGKEAGIDLITIGSAEFTIGREPVSRDRKVCVESTGLFECKKFETRTESCERTTLTLRFLVRTIDVKRAIGPKAGLIEEPDEYLACNGEIQQSLSSILAAQVGRLVNDGRPPASFETFKGNVADAGARTLLARLVHRTADYTRLGAITNSTIRGNTTINANVDTVTALAIGMNMTALTSQGAVGSVGAGQQQMAEPPFFPWPPPAPSLLGEVTSNFRISGDLAVLNRQIGVLLYRRGYDSLHYFGIEGGFVVTTDLERYGEDGRSASKDRWLIGKSGRARNFAEYLGNLLFGEKGRFRMFAFIVGTRDPGAAPFMATEQDTQRWKVTGAVALSARTGAQRIVPGTRVWLYVYEFESSLDKANKIVPLSDHAVPLAAHKLSLRLK